MNKFKKTIAFTIILCTLLSSVAGCDKTNDNYANIINETIETKHNEETDKFEDDNEINFSESTSSQTEIVDDVPDCEQLKLVSSINLTNASIWWSDEKEEYYIYINEWGVYRCLPTLSAYHNWLYYTDNCIIVEGETATIALIDQNGKHDEPTILTYHFVRNSAFVKLYDTPLNIKASSEYDTFIINMHSADCGYYFLTPNSNGSIDKRMEGKHEWPLFMFKTTDGGKTWNQISTNTFNGTKYVEVFKFVSPLVGIISFCELGSSCEVFDRTYLTVDGGLTWYQMPQLPHSETVAWYSEIIDLEYIEDCYYYRLTVEASNNGSDFQIQIWSKDLINWTLCEPQ